MLADMYVSSTVIFKSLKSNSIQPGGNLDIYSSSPQELIEAWYLQSETGRSYFCTREFFLEVVLLVLEMTKLHTCLLLL